MSIRNNSIYSDKTVRANVMKQSEMIERIISVTRTLSDIISSSIGPCGQNTLIQTVDNIVKTKDGYNIASNVDFDTYLDNSIRALVIEVAKTIVENVGDGSSSSIISSSYILENLYNNLYGKYSIREIEDAVTNIIDSICEDIYKNSTKLTEENSGEIIRKISLIATNWNIELSDAISKIYHETGNPVIKLLDGNDNSTHVEILEDSYDLAGQILIDDMINSVELGGMEVINPFVIMFNHSVSAKQYAVLFNLASKLHVDYGRRTCIIAPSFEAQFIQLCKDSNAKSLSIPDFGIGVLIPIKAFRTNDYDKECMEDFSLLSGCNIISPENEDYKFFSTTAHQTMVDLNKKPENVDELISTLKNNIIYCEDFMREENILGSVGSIVATKSEIRLIGSNDIFKDRVEHRINMLQSEVNAIESNHKSKAETMVRVKMKKQRLGKLKCKMGTIYVGGYGKADLKSKRDALDDAIRACETTFIDGYVTEGSSLSIPHSIDRIRDNYKDDELSSKVLDAIYNAFVQLFKTLINNKQSIEEYEKRHGICVDSIVKDTVVGDHHYAFDIMRDCVDCDCNVINPVRTDTEILKSAMRIVLAGLTSNQLIFKRFDAFSE